MYRRLSQTLSCRVDAPGTDLTQLNDSLEALLTPCEVTHSKGKRILRLAKEDPNRSVEVQLAKHIIRASDTVRVYSNGVSERLLGPTEAFHYMSSTISTVAALPIKRFYIAVFAALDVVDGDVAPTVGEQLFELQHDARVFGDKYEVGMLFRWSEHPYFRPIIAEVLPMGTNGRHVHCTFSSIVDVAKLPSNQAEDLARESRDFYERVLGHAEVLCNSVFFGGSHASPASS